MKKRILYTGLHLPTENNEIEWIHAPLIEIVPRALHTPDIVNAAKQFQYATHLLITSSEAVKLFCNFVTFFNLSLHIPVFATGKYTRATLEEFNIAHVQTPLVESQEGIIELIQNRQTKEIVLFWIKASRTRPLISDYCKAHSIHLIECVLYDTQYKTPPDFLTSDMYDEIYFSSTSTVDAYCHFFGLPKKPYRTKGHVTKHYIEMLLKRAT